MLVGIVFVVLSVLLLAVALIGRGFRDAYARKALAGKSVTLWIWRTACFSSTLFVWSAIFGIVSAVLITNSLWSWSQDPQGELLGVGVLLAVTATIIWEAAKHAGAAYWQNIEASLNKAIPKKEEAETKEELERRKRFNQYHRDLSPPDPRRDALNKILRQSSTSKLDMSSTGRRGNKRVAELRPLPAGKRLAELPGLLASLPGLSEGEAAEFADDLASARSVLSATDVKGPWAF